jgi:hypothetical protein
MKMYQRQLSVVAGMLLAASTMAVPAKAQWSITAEASGTKSPETPTGDWQGFSNSGTTQSNGYTRPTAVAQSQGKLVLTCIWQGAGTVPDTLNLRITSHASTSATCNQFVNGQFVNIGPSGLDVTAEVDNGFGDGPRPGKTWESYGTNLIQRKTNGQGTVIVEVPISAKITSTIKSSSYWGVAGAGVDASAQFDTRGVQLIRVGAPSPKMWDDPTLNKSRDEWIDKEGNRHGHSRVSYTKRTGTTYGGFTDEQIKILQYFQGSRSGSWSSNVTESWLAQSAGAFDTGANPPSLNLSPFKNGGSTATVQILNPIAGSSIPTGILHNQAGLTTDSNNVVIPAPLGAGWYYEPWGPGIWGPGAECIISYDVRDQADNAKARATYTLTLHNQWENKRDDWNHSWTDANGTLHLGNKLFTRAYFDDPEVSFTNNNTNGTSQTFSWTFGSIPAFTFGGDLSTDFNRHDYTKFGAHSGVGTTIDLSVPNGGSVTLQPGETAVPYVQVTWHRRYWLVDQFGINGFIGESSKWYDDIPAAIEAKWWITDANSTNNPPRPSTTPHQIS